jgi:L-threonylcarbamoyladenylate synthase
VPEIPSAAELDHAAAILRAGGLVAFPTETVYGLGANALDAASVARIYEVKGRPATSPLIVHVASIEMAKSLVASWPKIAERLAGKFWPGPLTLVLPKLPAIPDIVTAGLGTVGLRMPAHPVALALIKAAGVPLAAPSANRFTELSPTTAGHVRESLGSNVDLILDGGQCEVGIESTVLSLEGSRPVLLRPGGISRSELESVIGPVGMAKDIDEGPHPSPGMHARHYSPRTSLLLVSEGKIPDEGTGIYLQHTNPARVRDDARAELKSSGSGVRVIQMPTQPTGYAAALYEKLHLADGAKVDWIAVDLPPATPEWEAVHDRLQRAAGKSE